MKKLLIVLALSFLLTNIFAKALDVKDIMAMSTGATMSPTFTTMNYTYEPPYLKKRKEIKNFINNNFETLKVEIAEGQGETLSTLASFYRINDLDKWKLHLQSHFKEVFISENSEDTFNYINEITHNY